MRCKKTVSKGIIIPIHSSLTHEKRDSHHESIQQILFPEQDECILEGNIASVVLVLLDSCVCLEWVRFHILLQVFRPKSSKI